MELYTRDVVLGSTRTRTYNSSTNFGYLYS